MGEQKPDSMIEGQIEALVRDLHSNGHTRRDVVYNLRKVADRYEDYWSDNDSWNKSPSEKNVVLPDFEG